MSVNELSDDEAKRISKTLYNMLGNAIGFNITKGMLNLSNEDIESNDPQQTIGSILVNLKKSFGAQTLNNMVYVSVRSEFSDSESEEILKRIGLHLFDSMGE